MAGLWSTLNESKLETKKNDLTESLKLKEDIESKTKSGVEKAYLEVLKWLDAAKIAWLIETKYAKKDDKGNMEWDKYADINKKDYGYQFLVQSALQLLYPDKKGLFWDKGIDAEYGGKTTEAVKTFQTEIKIRPDGYAGPQTLAAMYYALKRNEWTTIKDVTVPEKIKDLYKDIPLAETGEKGEVLNKWVTKAQLDKMTKEELAKRHLERLWWEWSPTIAPADGYERVNPKGDTYEIRKKIEKKEKVKSNVNVTNVVQIIDSIDKIPMLKIPLVYTDQYEMPIDTINGKYTITFNPDRTYKIDSEKTPNIGTWAWSKLPTKLEITPSNFWKIIINNNDEVKNWLNTFWIVKWKEAKKRNILKNSKIYAWYIAQK